MISSNPVQFNYFRAIRNYFQKYAEDIIKNYWDNLHYSQILTKQYNQAIIDSTFKICIRNECTFGIDLILKIKDKMLVN